MKPPKIKVTMLLQNDNAVRKLNSGERWAMIEAAAFALRATVDQYGEDKAAALKAAIRLAQAPPPDFVRHKERVIETDRHGNERQRDIRGGDVEWSVTT